jgi:hypothetical protein
VRGAEAGEGEGVGADVTLEVNDFLVLQRGEARDVEFDGGGEEGGGSDEGGDVVIGGCRVLYESLCERVCYDKVSEVRFS